MSEQSPPGPAPTPDTAAGGNPWEDRRRDGLLLAFLETFKLFVASPREAFRRTPETGGLFAPLTFALVVYWVAMVAGLAGSLFLQAPSFLVSPGEPEAALGMAFGLFFLGLMVAVSPFLILAAIFLNSALVHLALWILGALERSTAGFEGTFRVICYAGVSQSASVVPLVGPLVALGWGIALQVIGLTHFHRTTEGRALVAVLLPILLCCGFMAAVALTIGAAVVSGLLSGVGG